MGRNLPSPEKIMEQLIEQLYPSIQHQLIKISSEMDLMNDEKDEVSAISQILQDIKLEFQSLISYENKLVFPSVLRVMAKGFDLNSGPDISQLIQLTESKENRIIHLANRLMENLKKTKQLHNKAEIAQLSHKFLSEFHRQKREWRQCLWVLTASGNPLSNTKMK